ncbi:hypothetical protein BDZ91DRAFT_799087 [Kalaharituber pfeilii]|nr:hypothetical protein BDZ91DRAFT_799087 [Kalaharituber pfeilii]
MTTQSQNYLSVHLSNSPTGSPPLLLLPRASISPVAHLATSKFASSQANGKPTAPAEPNTTSRGHGTKDRNNRPHQYCAWCGHLGHAQPNCHGLTAALKSPKIPLERGGLALVLGGVDGHDGRKSKYETIPYSQGIGTLKDRVENRDRQLGVPIGFDTEAHLDVTYLEQVDRRVSTARGLAPAPHNVNWYVHLQQSQRARFFDYTPAFSCDETQFNAQQVQDT